VSRLVLWAAVGRIGLVDRVGRWVKSLIVTVTGGERESQDGIAPAMTMAPAAAAAAAADAGVDNLVVGAGERQP